MKCRAQLAGVGSSNMGVGAAFRSGMFTTVGTDWNVDFNLKIGKNPRIKHLQSDLRVVRATDGSSSAASVIKFKQDNLNKQSKARFEKAIDITNYSDEDDSNVGLYVDDATSNVDDQGSLDFRENGRDSIVGSNSIWLTTEGSKGRNTITIDDVVEIRESEKRESSPEVISQLTFATKAVVERSLRKAS